MLERFRAARPSPSMAVALVALVGAFGGSALAEDVVVSAKKVIIGKNVKKRSLAGNRLKKNTVTGTEVRESKLAKVPLAAVADTAQSAERAKAADTATTATSAANATNATNATNAVNAANATNASNATNATIAATAGDADTLDGLDSLAFSQRLWAVVEATGAGATVVRHSGATGAGRLATGQFFVSFNRSIEGCAYVASVGDMGSGPAPALWATVEQRGPGNPTDVKLRSIDAAGNEADPGVGNGFHVSVLC